MKNDTPYIVKWFKRRVVLIAVLFTAARVSAHDEIVHEAMTDAAFRSSTGAAAFLSGTSGTAQGMPITGQPHPFEQGIQLTPLEWLMLGAYYEDATEYQGQTLRCLDHFYTVLPRPPGPLTDAEEHPDRVGLNWADQFGVLVPGLNLKNSFDWGSTRGVSGPNLKLLVLNYGDVGVNTETWQDARDYEYSALSSSSATARDSNLAHVFYSLGHVLHLNQDLSQPDHVRNDNHFSKRYIEDFGSFHYLGDALTDPILYNSRFPQRPRGWAWWKANQFSQLKDFWDRNKYNGNFDALDADSIPLTQLGLTDMRYVITRCDRGKSVLKRHLLMRRIKAHMEFTLAAFPSTN